MKIVLQTKQKLEDLEKFRKEIEQFKKEKIEFLQKIRGLEEEKETFKIESLLMKAKNKEKSIEIRDNNNFIFRLQEENRNLRERIDQFVREERDVEKRVKKGKVDLGGGFTYEGQWLGDKPDGEGVQTCSLGIKFEGSFKNGLPCGIGKATWADGSSYYGELQMGKLEGMGVKVEANGQRYDGSFKDGF